MADLEKVINQAIADFDEIKFFLEKCGIEIPRGTDTKDYPQKIGEAVALAYAAALNEVPIKKVDSPDADGNYLNLFELESGTYVLYGKFRPYPNANRYFTFSKLMLVSVSKGSLSTCVQVFYPPYNTIQYLNIWADDTLAEGYTYERKDAKLYYMEDTQNKVTEIDENSDDEHYPSAKAVYDKVKDTSNTLKANASGEVIRVDDVSPIEHKVKAKVSGKNLIDLSQALNECLTLNSDGTYTLTKTSANRFSNDISVNIAPNTPFTVSYSFITSSEISSSTILALYITFADGKKQGCGFSKNTFSFTKVYEKAITGVSLYLMANETTGAYVTFENLMIEKGDTATEYEPYVDPSTVTVTRCGKNLLDLTQEHDVTGTYWGWIINPTADDVTMSLVDNDTSVELGEVYLGFTDTGFDATGGFGGWVVQKGAFSYEPRTSNLKYISVFPRTADTIEKLTKRFHIQVERGTVVTDFELPMHERYIPEADGTINGITSVSPTMTLLTDTEGANIEIEYNQDINAAFDKINDLLEVLLNGGA